jgi:hypothetical protein
MLTVAVAAETLVRSILDGEVDHAGRLRGAAAGSDDAVTQCRIKLLPANAHIHAQPHDSALDRPDTPLARSALLTGTRLDPSLDSQLRKEIATADAVQFSRLDSAGWTDDAAVFQERRQNVLCVPIFPCRRRHGFRFG